MDQGSNVTTSNNQPALTWRDVLPVHPAAELLPRMAPKALRALGEDIKANGLQTPVVVHAGKLLDGIGRLDGMTMAGLDVIEAGTLNSDLVKSQEVGGADFDPVAFVFSANVHRRHLLAKDRRALAGKLLERYPERSDRQIAALVGISHHTVEVVRRELEGRGQIAHVESRTDTKGRKQPARKPVPPAAPDIDKSDEPGIDEPEAVASAFNRFTAKDVDRFFTKLSSAHHRALNQHFGERNDQNAEIAKLAREIRAFCNHPQQHVDEIKKKLARILAIAEPDGKRPAKVVKSGAKLDGKLFSRALGLGSAAAIRAVEASRATATEPALRARLDSQIERLRAAVL